MPSPTIALRTEKCIRTIAQTLSQKLRPQRASKLHSRLFTRHIKRTRRRLVRYSLLIANLALLVGVVVFVSQSPTDNVNSQNAILGPSSTAAANPLDQLSSAEIAVHVSRLTDMAEAVAITNQADSESVQLAITPADNIVVAKPQLVSTASKSAKDIITYTTSAGDTLQSLATRFGVTSDSIRWSNSLTSNTLPAGRQLFIPPVNGIVYEVRSGDTAESLAQNYASNKDVIIADNDAEISGLRVGQRILIRDGVQPVRRAATTTFSFGFSAIYGFNGYDRGYCTWWAATRRAQIGNPIPANLGNACTWLPRARAAGMSTGSAPRAGAVIWTKSGCLGHVGFVEKVLDDGSVWVSDMNSSGHVQMDTSTSRGGGWGRVSYRLLSPEQAANFFYIY